MKKVLLISDKLEHYRIEMFNLLCVSVNLTVAHSSTPSVDAKFSQYPLVTKKKGPFIVYETLPNLNSYDIVIFPFNLRCIQLLRILQNRRRHFKLVVFGIGVSASYDKLYDAEKKLDFIRLWILKKCDAAIFYEQYPYIKYSSRGISKSKMSIAYNTVKNNPNFSFEKKEYKSFIFIGNLYKQKKIFDLLEAYELAEKEKVDFPDLEIIGAGDEFENIIKWREAKGLNKKIILHGKLVHDDQLSPIFTRAIACISPGQAGLSVQKCFSYGVPFVTSYNAITGGEMFSIIDGTTGFVYDSSITQLKEVLLKLVDSNYNLKKMSSNCLNFYSEFRNVEIWKEGFLKNVL